MRNQPIRVHCNIGWPMAARSVTGGWDRVLKVYNFRVKTTLKPQSGVLAGNKKFINIPFKIRS